MSKFKLIRIYYDDMERLRNDVLKEYCKHHPEHTGLRMHDAFLTKKIIDFYLKT